MESFLSITCLLRLISCKNTNERFQLFIMYFFIQDDLCISKILQPLALAPPPCLRLFTMKIFVYYKKMFTYTVYTVV